MLAVQLDASAVVVRSALTSVAHVTDAAIERALKENRPIRPTEVAYLTAGDVVRFTSAEWEAKPEKAYWVYRRPRRRQ